MKGVENKSCEKKLREPGLYSLENSSGETLLYFTITLKEVVERWGSGFSSKHQGKDERKWPQVAPGEV